MPYKNIEDRRACSRRYYQRNKKKAYQRRAQLKKMNKGWLAEQKNQPCVDCGHEYPSYVMDWDHMDEEKIGNISRLVHEGSMLKARLEIAKCELVCANCHRIRTYNRHQNT